MTTDSSAPSIDFTVDKNNLYREEAYTDLRVASIRILRPVKIDGSDDPARPALFFGHTQLMSPDGPIPIQSELKAATLEEAIREFPVSMGKAMKEIIESIRELHREEMEKNQSRIITPR